LFRKSSWVPGDGGNRERGVVATLSTGYLKKGGERAFQGSSSQSEGESKRKNKTQSQTKLRRSTPWACSRSGNLKEMLAISTWRLPLDGSSEKKKVVFFLEGKLCSEK